MREKEKRLAAVVTGLALAAPWVPPVVAQDFEVVRGRHYKLPKVVACANEAAAREMSKRPVASRAIASGCEVREGDDFYPDRKLPDLKAYVKEVLVHPGGRSICEDMKTGGDATCDVEEVLYGFIVGTMKGPDGRYYEVFVQVNDRITVVDNPRQ